MRDLEDLHVRIDDLEKRLAKIEQLAANRLIGGSSKSRKVRVITPSRLELEKAVIAFRSKLKKPKGRQL